MTTSIRRLGLKTTLAIAESHFQFPWNVQIRGRLQALVETYHAEAGPRPAWNIQGLPCQCHLLL